MDAINANIQECHDELMRYKGDMIYKLRRELTLTQPNPIVCGVETQRELITPGRTQYSTQLATENSCPAMLLYLLLLLIAGSLFIAVNASPELKHLINTGIDSRDMVVLSAIIVMVGCKPHNGGLSAYGHVSPLSSVFRMSAYGHVSSNTYQSSETPLEEQQSQRYPQ